MSIIVSRDNQGPVHLVVSLPTSKSICNRLLIMQAITPGGFAIDGISDSDDTVAMKAALEGKELVADIGHAGTSMRFLTAYYAGRGEEKVMTGSARMKERPIGELVNALRQIGAVVDYVEKEGFPPLHIHPIIPEGEELTINGGISSQYISALLMIAPVLAKGLRVHIAGRLISSSYVRLTLGLMKRLGIMSRFEGNLIEVPHQDYIPVDCRVEGDWSGASYWYEIMALAPGGEVELLGLEKESLQGDAALVRLFEPLGVSTRFKASSVILQKHAASCSFFEFDFQDNPDLVQTFAVTLCMMGIPFRLAGADTLRVKETDRIKALQVELAKLGFDIRETSKGVLEWDGKPLFSLPHEVLISTYKDHRMALSFAPLAFVGVKTTIEDPGVVNKSYPMYWDHLREIGCTIDQ